MRKKIMLRFVGAVILFLLPQVLVILFLLPQALVILFLLPHAWVAHNQKMRKKIMLRFVGASKPKGVNKINQP
jgi:hypothetical protein